MLGVNGPDYIVDIEGLGDARREASSGADFQGRPWIAVRWRCCSAYSRIYRNKAGTAYEGRCPRCAAPVRARVGPGGTDTRFFEAG